MRLFVIRGKKSFIFFLKIDIVKVMKVKRSCSGIKGSTLTTVIFTQIFGIIFLYINTTIAFALFFAYFLSLLVLLIALIKSRINEKKRDDDNDYRNY